MYHPQRLSLNKGVHPQANGGLGNEKYVNVGRCARHDIVCSFSEKLKKFIRELHSVANCVNTRPNSLGNSDRHKITFGHRQLHPSAIGKIDLLESSKDVGQTGMLSPWGEKLDVLFDADVNKYPNISFELFNFIKDEFNNVAFTFNCDNVRDYNKLMDKLVASAYVNIEFKIPEAKEENADDI